METSVLLDWNDSLTKRLVDWQKMNLQNDNNDP